MNNPVANSLEQILDLLPTLVFRVDLAGRYTYANRAFAAAFGIDPSTPAGKAGMLSNTTGVIDQHVPHVLITGESREYQASAPTPRGRAELLIKLVAQRDATGAVGGLVGVGTEITMLEHAKAALAESEHRLRLLIDNVTEYALFMLDTDGRITSWNPGAQRLKGYAATEVIGRHLSMLYPPESQPDAIAQHLHIAATCGRYQAEGWRLRRDGSRFWANAVITPLRDDDGILRGFAKITQDLTERRAAEESLRESENRYRHVVEDQTEVVFRFKADNTLSFVNDVFLRTFGDEPAWLQDRPWHKVILPEELPQVLAQLTAISAANPVVRLESRIIDCAGDVRWMEFVNRGFHETDGRLREVQAVGRDITDRRTAEDARHELEASLRDKEQKSRYEQQIMQSQKLESLGVLAGGIAHDFNNLLTGMLGYASLARARASPNDPVVADLSRIEESALRAADLCQQMLAYAGRAQFVVAPVDLNQLTEGMAQLLGTVVSKRAVMKFNLFDRLPLVRADATQIRQVVMNLITNASDAIGARSGVITVTTGVIEADERYLREIGAPEDRPAGRYVYLEVSDNGAGMTEEVRQRIFEPFFTTKFTGRGLGLAAVQGIVRAHHGAIRVYSQLNAGTTFKILLPALADATTAATTTAAPARLQGHGRHILVVDDDEDIRVFMRAVLEGCGFTVTLATDGRDGVQRFVAASEPFALVMLDLTMPHMSGAEAFRHLRNHRPDVRVVLTSGFAVEEATGGFQGKGLAGFLRKPFRTEDLLTMVDAALATEAG